MGFVRDFRLSFSDEWPLTMRLVSALIASVAVAVLFLAPATLAGSEDLGGLLRELSIPVPSREVSAPPFSLPDTTGAPVRLAGYKGRPVMIYFWTT
ncbi:MAG: peroxiredoxin family protein, partial [Pseudonocardiaceae bacterium]